jgi:RimJ/RimL family protein N-acetyltransferase
MNLDRALTDRLTLHRPTDADAADLHRFYTNAETMATLGGLRGPDETRRLVNKIIIHWTLHDFGAWIIRETATGSFIGRGGLRMMLIDGVPEVELGYGLLPEFWGRGYATEVARAGVRAAFESLNVPSLICFTLTTNVASRAVMTKVGFTFERDGWYAGEPHVFHRLRRPS